MIVRICLFSTFLVTQIVAQSVFLGGIELYNGINKSDVLEYYEKSRYKAEKWTLEGELIGEENYLLYHDDSIIGTFAFFNGKLKGANVDRGSFKGAEVQGLVQLLYSLLLPFSDNSDVIINTNHAVNEILTMHEIDIKLYGKVISFEVFNPTNGESYVTVNEFLQP